MNTRLTLILSAALILASLLAGAILYPQMPEQMPVHWNAAGQVDGYGSRFMGLFLFPLVTLGVGLLMLVIPVIDPLKKNIAAFRPTYNLIMFGFIVYFTYLYGLTLGSALGYQFNMNTFLMPAMAVLAFGIGHLLKNAKRNYMVGIRTPWTLASDQAWAETHRVGSIAFKICAGLTLIGLFFGELGIWIFLVSILTATVLVLVYSYFAYQRATDKIQ